MSKDNTANNINSTDAVTELFDGIFDLSVR